MRERWFNYRPILLVFAFLLLGSVFAFYLKINTIATVICAVSVLILLIVLSVLNKHIKYALIPIIAFVFGVGGYFLAIHSFNKQVEYSPTEIQMRISGIDIDGTKLKAHGDSCIFDGVKTDDEISVIIYDNDEKFNNLEIGSIIKVIPSKFYHSDLFYYGTPNANLYANNTKYTVVADILSVEYIDTDKTVAEWVRERVKTGVNFGLTKENTELVFSALFGDKTSLESDTLENFKLAGVAHLLAVSGLHVGIIVAFLTKMFKLMKIKGWWTLLILAPILLFYAYVCGFSISVLRALIMALILQLSKILKREYDIYNAISIAGIIIFLINPLCAFSASFLLSFSCVFGIAVLYKPIKSIFSHLPDKIASAISVSCATSLAMMIIMAYFFNNFNVISIVANIILIPLFTIAFICAFVIGMLCVVVQQFGYLLFPLNFLLNFINFIASFLGHLSFANLATVRFDYLLIILYIFVLTIIGKLCTISKKKKVLYSLPIFAVMIFCLI